MRRSLLTHVALLCVCALYALPLLWMVRASLQTNRQLLGQSGGPLTLASYRAVRDQPNFPLRLLAHNTLIVATLSVAGVTLSSAVVAYGFARLRFRGRGLLFALMLSTMMIPFTVTMVPLFCIFRFLGDHGPIQFLGTFRPLWMPMFFSSAFHVFLLRQFFRTIPEELSEAARLDGCGEWGIFWRIILPLAKPALTVVALLAFMAAWNDFLGPLVYLQHPGQYTLALGLQVFQSQSGGVDTNLLMAASILVIAPVILLFFLAQRTFIAGIATTGQANV